MAGGVDEVDDVIGLAAVGFFDLPWQAHVLRLDGDATLALDVHAIEVLGAHLPLLDHAGELQHAVGQVDLPVDMGDDAEVPDARRVSERGVGKAGNGSYSSSKGSTFSLSCLR